MKITERLFKKSGYNKYLIGAAALVAVAVPSSVVAYSSMTKSEDSEKLTGIVEIEHAESDTTLASASTSVSSTYTTSETTSTSVASNGPSVVESVAVDSMSLVAEITASGVDCSELSSKVKTATDKIKADREEKARFEAEALAVAEEQTNSDSWTEPVQEQVTYSWSGAVLSPQAGVVYGPSGKETYYNLDMSGVVSIMRGMGFDEASYPYWVRSDGCKMLGNYIMVAADLSIRPRGSVISCSLGDALVCDTGGFIYSDPYQLDIAVTW